MKILVIQKKRIGDVLTSTLILEALKEKFPSSELHYLIYKNSLPVVLNNPFIDKTLVMDEKTRKTTIPFLQFLFKIRKEKYNVIIDAYSKPNSVIIGWFSGAKKTIGFEKIYTRFFYTHPMKREETKQTEATAAIEHRMLLLKPLKIPFKIIAPKIFLTNKEIEAAKIRLQKAQIDTTKKIVMISALGSNETKTYPLNYMAFVLDEIAKHDNILILLNYLPWQKQQVKIIYEACLPETKSKIAIDFYEEDLRKFLATTFLCKALIGNEGGATNMAKALKIPTFTIFCPGISKKSWSLLENKTTNISVHADDYNILGENNFVRYERFKPNFFKEKLNQFLNYNLK